MKLHDIDYFKYGKIENKKFWKRLGSKPDFKNKKVLDFGCGHGSLTLDIAALGAQKVIGIDLEIKEKILKEMKKGTEKENFFSDEERVILSRFINKILKELKTETPK